MMNHKHNWQPVITDEETAQLTETQQIDFMLLMMGKTIYRRCFFCAGCGKTGHQVKTKQERIRIHYDDYVVKDINKLRGKFGWPPFEVLHSEQQKDQQGSSPAGLTN